MKRRSAIILFGSLTLICVGYIAWCGRCFYLERELDFPSDTPGVARDAMHDWQAHTHINLCERFTWPRLWAHLAHPGSKEGRSLTVVAHEFANPNFTGDPRIWLLSIDHEHGHYWVTVMHDADKGGFLWQESFIADTVMTPTLLEAIEIQNKAYEKHPTPPAGEPLPPGYADDFMETIRSAEP